MDNNQKLTKIYIYYVFIYDEPVAWGPRTQNPIRQADPFCISMEHNHRVRLLAKHCAMIRYLRELVHILP